MNIKQVQRILMTNFFFMVIVSLLLVALYETEILTPMEKLGADASLMFGIMVVMELLTILVIPVAQKGDALLVWGTTRINMLCLPMLINTFMYYQTMAPAFGYMAIILMLCLFFVYPSMERCTDETSGEER